MKVVLHMEAMKAFVQSAVNGATDNMGSIQYLMSVKRNFQETPRIPVLRG